jgi:superfamily II DNA or RNA helicase
MSRKFRYYQSEADDVIYQELITTDKCLVKMFCGTGKSLLMRKCKIIENKKLVVFVFPSLSLIEQFSKDYLHDFPYENMLKISSECESTTNPIEIIQFLSKSTDKIICITYQSFKTLLDHLGETKIDVCIFDEAHHAVGETYQKLIFENNVCDKQIFFTATPKNANGIIMYDRNNLDSGMCGKLVYDYSYLRGMNEGYLNPFEIRIDMYSENTNKSVYESIARAILSSGNSRVLTFHSDVNTERDTSVVNFVDEKEFKKVFKEIQKTEFPKSKKYKNISMIALTGDTPAKKRKIILDNFDATKDDEVFVISSCETIGEGIDTKNANMCVFVDPKSSYIKIIQNIGRIVRKIFGQDKSNSTILIPCWVDKTKYLECEGDREKCDEVIRQDMGDSGNFNGILNVMSALKQEDEDLYEICLHYPDTYSPQEIRSNLEKQGYIIDETVGEGSLLENIEHLLETEIDYDEYADCDSDEEMIMRIAEENNVCVEIHTTSLENPIETYNGESENGNIIRLYKSFDEETEENIYQPIIHKETRTKRNSGYAKEPKRENRLNINVHTNSDVKVLWNIVGGVDIAKEICSCIIDCEVVDNWFERFEEVKQFIYENGRRPSVSSKDSIEKHKGQWVGSQQHKYKNKILGMKNEIKYNLWSLFLEEYKEYFKNDDETWYENFHNLKSFIDTNKKRPVTKSKNEIEKKNGCWLANQNKNYKDKKQSMKDIKKYNLWTTFLEDYKEYVKDFNDIWYETFQELKSFIDVNKRKPMIESKNNIEDKLAHWISNQRTNYKKKEGSMKDEVRYNLWTKFVEEYKEYLRTDDEQWYDTFEKLKIFIDKYEKRPVSKSTNEIEKKLGIWFITHNRNYNRKINSMKDEIKYNLWTIFLEKYNEYFQTDDDNWYKHFDELKIFINKYNTKPTKESTIELAKQNAAWMNSQIHKYKVKEGGMKDEKIYNLWTEFVEEYKEYLKTYDETWYENFHNLKTFIDKYEKRPVKESKNEIEKNVGHWLSNQISNYKKKEGGMKDKIKYNLWTEFAEEYKEYLKTDDETWYENFQELKTFIDTNEKKPSKESKNESEQKILQWLYNQTSSYNKKEGRMKDEVRYNLWTDFLEEYNKYFCDIWYDTFDKVKQFICTNNKKPSSHSKNIFEKRLGRWIDGQKKNYKNKTCGMKDKTKYNLWTQFLEDYKEYVQSDEENWYDNFEKVKLFIKENKKRPSSHSQNSNVKKLGSWIVTQQSNYKRKINVMKDEVRYNLWTQFLEDYKEYFNNDDTQSITTESIEEEPIEEIIIMKKPKKTMKLKKSSIKEDSKELKRERIKSEISLLHKEYKTLKSSNLHNKFKESPELWTTYHKISEENEESFPEEEIPRNRIIQELNKIKTKRTKNVVDMGCGKGQISQYFKDDKRFQFINYDHISSNDTVISCDISKLPLEEDAVEICILSLAMWGYNCREYIMEANRILESGGILYIIEPTKRWSEKDDAGNIIDGKEGSKLKSWLEENGFQIIENSIEKFCLFKCIKN